MTDSDSRSDKSRSRVFSPEFDEVDSFEEICSEVRPLLKSVVEARLDPQLLQRVDSSDVVQEALLEAFSRLADFRVRRPMSLIAWLRETAIQQVGIAIRRHRTTAMRTVSRQISLNQSSVMRCVEQMTAIRETADMRWERKEQTAATERALLRLDSLDREILMLRYVNELTNQEAARVLGLTDTAASKRHCRALQRLQKELEQS